MADMTNNADVVQAIRELTRVMILLNGDFDSQADAVRQLADLGISSSKIAEILDMQTKNVSSILNRARKQAAITDNNGN